MAADNDFPAFGVIIASRFTKKQVKYRTFAMLQLGDGGDKDSVRERMPVIGVESNVGALSGVLIFNILAAWPLWRIYRRCGLPGWWSLAAFAPLVGLVAVVALLGHIRWPALPEHRSPAPMKKARRSVVRSPQAPTE